ncbi:polyprenyl diphosphate synthase [Streptomyces lunaelactis]|uniref:polyprenyl diphosphate synthase n=1 Tax=Streptomyces lunaelactis TaxID=1535768 RepID=UPI0015850975|nr:polyprenyl diphosphate synthase [Streptomyces lunaelactis]NUL25959.1 di-trans,poly-cis-decaprenylcistransferase [Streptomyces lunaelactis]
MTTTDLGPAPAVLETTLPRHIAFIADGNRRWARANGTTHEEGFRQGAAAVHRTLEDCRTLGIETASVFLMSDRNFERDPAEVAVLVDVIADLVDTAAAASTGPVRILSSGATMPVRAPQFLKDTIERAEQKTAERTGMTVCFGIGYDGHADIAQAMHRAATATHHAPSSVPAVEHYLTTAGLPDPDLIIRTSGERRLSGFLLWQSADATIHFDDRLWPDYDTAALVEALAVHSTQTRTYGR